MDQAIAHNYWQYTIVKKKKKKTEVAATTIIKASARAKRKEGKISKKPKPNLAALLGHSARPVSAQTHPP